MKKKMEFCLVCDSKEECKKECKCNSNITPFKCAYNDLISEKLINMIGRLEDIHDRNDLIS